MSNVIATVNIQEDCDITVVKRHKVNLPAFCMVGTGARRSRMSSIDMPVILQNASKAANWLFWTLVILKDPTTNKAALVAQNQPEMKQITKGYQELNKAGVVKRIRRGVYLINPKAHLPIPSHFDAILLEWNKL